MPKAMNKAPKRYKLPGICHKNSFIHLPVGEMFICFLIVLQPGEGGKSNNVVLEDIRQAESLFLKEGWRKRKCGAGSHKECPPHSSRAGSGRARRAGIAFISLPAPCTGSAQAAQIKCCTLWSIKH